MSAFEHYKGYSDLNGHNLALNGDFRINQYPSTAKVHTTSIDNGYFCDGWKSYSAALTSGQFTVQQDYSSNSSVFPGNFPYYADINVDTGVVMPAASDIWPLYFDVMGKYAEALLLDYPFTLSFYMKSNVSGTFVARYAGTGGASNLDCFQEFTYDGSENTKRIIIHFPTLTSTYLPVTTYARGFHMSLFELGGTSWQYSGTKGVFVDNGSNYYSGTTTATNWAATTGNYIRVSGIQIESGECASEFDHKPYAESMLECNYYWRQYKALRSNGYVTGASQDDCFCHTHFNNRMRPTPSIYIGTPTTTNLSSTRVRYSSENCFVVDGSSTAAGMVNLDTGSTAVTCDARI